MLSRRVESATLSASGGLYANTSARSTECQMGKITLCPSISRAVSPLSSYCGQFLAKNAGDNTTIPNREFTRPFIYRLTQAIAYSQFELVIPNSIAKLCEGHSQRLHEPCLVLARMGNEGVVTNQFGRGRGLFVTAICHP